MKEKEIIQYKVIILLLFAFLATLSLVSFVGKVEGKYLFQQDSRRLDDSIDWYATIQMVYNSHSNLLSMVYTKWNDVAERREVWFKSIREGSISTNRIGYCSYGRCPVSIAINPGTGEPAVAYRDENGDLIFSHLLNGSWLTETVSTIGLNCSLAFDPADNYPAIAFNSGVTITSTTLNGMAQHGQYTF